MQRPRVHDVGRQSGWLKTKQKKEGVWGKCCGVCVYVCVCMCVVAGSTFLNSACEAEGCVCVGGDDAKPRLSQQKKKREKKADLKSKGIHSPMTTKSTSGALGKAH